MSGAPDNKLLPEEARVPAGQDQKPIEPQDDETIEIEIVEEGESEAKDPPETPAPPAAVAPKGPKRPRSDPQRRIDQLTAQKHDAETTAQRLWRETEDFKKQLAEERQQKEAEAGKRAEAERVAAVHYESSLKSQIEVQQRQLKEAIALGDVEKQGAATSELARIEATRNGVSTWLAQNPEKKPEDRPTPEARPAAEQPKPRQEEQTAPASREFNPAPVLEPWIQQNPWFDPRTENFDMEMHAAATAYAADLERRYVQAGKQSQIAKPEYFDRITRYMQNEYPDYEWDGGTTTVEEANGNAAVTIPAISAPNRLVPPSERINGRQQTPQPRIPTMTRNTSVLPVTNGAAAPAASKATRVELSPDEKQQAVLNWQHGNVGNHWKTGKKISSEREAVEQFAYRKMQIARGQ